MSENAYMLAKNYYAGFGIDTEAAMDELENISISMHCWQGDDVQGFENSDALSGGIQATGSYLGKARNPQELMADIDKVLSLIPGKHRINLHAIYAIPENGKVVERNKLRPEDFSAWVEFARERGLGIDFNPTLFSHPLSKEATLSSEKEDIRHFWVEHVQACLAKNLVQCFTATDSVHLTPCIDMQDKIDIHRNLEVQDITVYKIPKPYCQNSYNRSYKHIQITAEFFAAPYNDGFLA